MAALTWLKSLSINTPIRILLLCRTICFGAFLVFKLLSLFEPHHGPFPMKGSLLILGALFHLASLWYFRHRRQASDNEMTLQVLADLALMTLLLSMHGGATNAFVSMLLIPIVFAGVSLSAARLVAVTLGAIAAYTSLLMAMDPHAMHHMDMDAHFIGMWLNFLVNALIITLVVGTMAWMIVERERRLARQREAQLQQEQLIALGIASAQVTHQLATPLGTLQLLHEELQDDRVQHPALAEMGQPLQACSDHLNYFRQLAADIRADRGQNLSVSELVRQLTDASQLHFPEQQLQWQGPVPDCELVANAMLVPALLNLVQNAARANSQTGQQQIELACRETPDNLVLTIRDHGPGIKRQRLKELGGLVHSEVGLGMAVMLSNATLERLNGELHLANHPEQGLVATVTLVKQNP